MNVLPLVLTALLVMVIAYRYYGAFLAAKVVALDDRRITPAHTMADGQNYHATNKWVLFGHHFAAIAGAGPLIGPVLAAQFGYVPSFVWLLAGVCLAGAVHDFMILAASIRRKGKSLMEIIRHEISPLASVMGAIAIFIIIIVALAGLGLAVVNALKDSGWGTFSIAMTIPIAFLVGFWMRRTPHKIGPASAVGVVLVVLAVVFGNHIPGSSLAPFFTFHREGVIWALAGYGFLASVLPVWMLLAPRDYLSAYMKVGTIVLLVVGIMLVNPVLQMPAFGYVDGGGPIIPGKLFPFVFITIACGAISGFHALVSSGTTPKMLDKETDARMIGYGSMLIEGLVGIVALLSTCSLFPADYFAINLSLEKFQALGMNPVNLQQLSAAVGENVAGRPGGAVSLAVGFAQIFTGIPGLRNLMGYFYHFMIMFEALFILTTIDAGTRIARFLVQEFVGRFWKPFENPNWLPASLLSTGFVVLLWGYFIWTGSVGTVWPMFGTANQLLATIALAAATSAIINTGRARYAWVTFIPMLFVAVTTLSACWLNITDNYLPLAKAQPNEANSAYIKVVLTSVIMVCAVVVLWESFRRWYLILVKKKHPKALQDKDHQEHEWPEYGCC
jgi:carbon starvation protein